MRKDCKLTKDQAIKIQELYQTGAFTYRELGKLYSIGHMAIRSIIKGTTYKNEHYDTTICKNKTIGEYRNYCSVQGKHPSWIHTHIRSFARSWLNYLTKLPCRKCGYSKHVDLCHIRSVSSFPDTALLSEVNDKNNIIQLCKNCHWEFDNLPREEFNLRS